MLESLDPDFVRVMALEALEFTPGRSQTEEYRSGKYLEGLDLYEGFSPLGCQGYQRLAAS